MKQQSHIVCSLLHATKKMQNPGNIGPWDHRSFGTQTLGGDAPGKQVDGNTGI